MNLASCNIDVDRTKNRTTQNSNYLLFIDMTRAYVFYSVSPFSANRVLYQCYRAFLFVDGGNSHEQAGNFK